MRTFGTHFPGLPAHPHIPTPGEIEPCKPADASPSRRPLFPTCAAGTIKASVVGGSLLEGLGVLASKSVQRGQAYPEIATVHRKAVPIVAGSNDANVQSGAPVMDPSN